MDIEGPLDDVVERARAWIAETGEVFAVARYSRAAGSRDYRLFSDTHDLSRWSRSLPADCNLLVLKDYHLSLRGTAGMLAAEVPAESDVEWLVLVGAARNRGEDRAFECWGTAEVLTVLADHADDYAVAGRMPAWNSGVYVDAPATLSAIAPRPDGSVHRGVY